MMELLKHRIAAKCAVALAAVLSLAASVAQAQVAPIRYWIPGGPFGLGGETTTQYWGSAPDEDGFRKGFSFSSYSMPASSFTAPFSAGAFTAGSGLSSDGAQYGYSFKGLGDTPVTIFGGVSSLRTTPDAFTSIVTPELQQSNTLATSVNAGIAFKPTSNVTLSLSGSFVQSNPSLETDLRAQTPFAHNPGIFGRR